MWPSSELEFSFITDGSTLLSSSSSLLFEEQQSLQNIIDALFLLISPIVFSSLYNSFKKTSALSSEKTFNLFLVVHAIQKETW